MDEGEDEEEIVPGKIPEYPRGMLKLELGDGRAAVKAIEYKRLGDLKLGETALGCKVSCSTYIQSQDVI
jgi:RecQ-mediated genome instability protein 1